MMNKELKNKIIELGIEEDKATEVIELFNNENSSVSTELKELRSDINGIYQEVRESKKESISDIANTYNIRNR